jgi:hypothetical protein
MKTFCLYTENVVQKFYNGAKSLEEMLFLSSIMPKEMKDDLWLQNHLCQMVEDEILDKKLF